MYIKAIRMDSDAKRLAAGIAMITFYSIIELLYGYKSNSLGLLSSGFHSLFDSAVLFTSLVALLIAQRNPTLEYSYGYERFEVLAAFTNASFLIFISLYIFLNLVRDF